MKPSLITKTEAEKTLTGQAMAALMAAVLDRGVPFRFAAKGSSMSPFIKDGDILTLHPVYPKNIRIGDVVAVFHGSSQKLMVHRCIQKTGNDFVMKGDNNPGPDGRVAGEDILGIVKTVERKGKKIYFGMGKERSFIALLTRKNLLIPLLRKSRMLRIAFG